MSAERTDLPASPTPAAAPAPRAATNTVVKAAPATVYFDLPPTDVTTIPDVLGFVATVRATGMKPVVMNQNITRGYAQFARVFQAIVDPDFAGSGTPPRSARAPNWFAFAPHASDEAGKGMISVGFGRVVLDALEREGPLVETVDLLEGLGLEGPSKTAAHLLAGAARAAGLPGSAALVLGALATVGNYGAFGDPRTLAATVARMAELFAQAPGTDALRKVESIVTTLERTLAEGNLGIYSDVGGAAQTYLRFRRSAGALPAEEVLGHFLLPGASSADARKAFELAQRSAGAPTQPADFDTLFPGVSGASLMVASFALYEQIRSVADPARKDQLIAFANNCAAYREQHDAVQPYFTPDKPQPGEVSRAAVMHAFTPSIQLRMGAAMWRFSAFAERQPDRDRSFLTSHATEYNWAVFQDRWPAILDSFELGYRDAVGIWQLPVPGRE